jgi:hypothetical protein
MHKMILHCTSIMLLSLLRNTLTGAELLGHDDGDGGGGGGNGWNNQKASISEASLCCSVLLLN